VNLTFLSEYTRFEDQALVNEERYSGQSRERGMRWLLWGLLTIFAAVVPSTFSWAQAPEETIVREIEVRFSGPETVNRAVVMANIQTAVGKPRNPGMIEQDVRNLINTGYFYDVAGAGGAGGGRRANRLSGAGQGHDQGNHHGGKQAFSRRTLEARIQPESGGQPG